MARVAVQFVRPAILRFDHALIEADVSTEPSTAINPYQSPREPAGQQRGPRVFTPLVRGSILAMLVGPIVVLSLGGPVIGTAAAYAAAPQSSPALWLGSLLGAAVATLAVLSWLHVANTWANRGLARRLAAVWREAGINVEACGGRFVELAAAAEPRVYHGGMTNWDVGFILLTAERLVYLGDLAAFSVARGQIEHLRRGPSGIERMMPECLYLQWRQSDGAHREGFGVAPAEGSLRARQWEVERLESAIETWRLGRGEATSALPADFALPPPPELASVPSRSLWAHLAFSISAGGVALIIGLGLATVDLQQHLAGRITIPQPLVAGVGGIALGLAGLMAVALSPSGMRAALAQPAKSESAPGSGEPRG